MISNASDERLKLAARIAKENGVSVNDVLAKFDRAVKKNAFTLADFFWGESDISLPRKRAWLRSQNRGRAALSKVVRKKGIKQ